MPRHKQPDRVIGIFEDNRGRERRVVYVLGGRRCSETRETEAIAKAYAEKLQRDFTQEGQSIEDRLKEYVQSRADLLPRSVESWWCFIRAMIPKKDMVLPLAALTLAYCERRYREISREEAGYSPNYHQSSLHRCKAWGDWLVKKRYLKANPFAGIEPTGRLRAGKPQLRRDEAKKWLDAALALYHQGKKRYLFAVVALVLGLRHSQIKALQVRDLDEEGTILWVPWVKQRAKDTPRPPQRVEVPDMLRPLLKEAAGKRGGEESLLGTWTIQAVLLWVREICVLAGVPRICTHSLRGMHATLARLAGATGHAVMQQLGHGSIHVQERSYLADGTKEATQRRRAFAVILGNDS